MSPQQAYRNVKSGMTSPLMQKDFFRWLKANKSDQLLAMQMQQLFQDSEGADSVALGSYASNKKKGGKTKGQPFTMIDTKELFNRMKVVISITNLEINFINNRSNVNTIRQSDVFGTSEWFGLTNKHFAILKTWALDYSIRWTLNKFSTGNGKIT